MPKFMFTFSYTPEVWAGLIRTCKNREQTVSRILDDAGCKLHGLWYAFGEHDGYALMEAPDKRPPRDRDRDRLERRHSATS